MDPSLQVILVNALVALLAAATLWIKAQMVQNDLKINTDKTSAIQEIVNGERTAMVTKISRLEEQVHILTEAMLSKNRPGTTSKDG